MLDKKIIAKNFSRGAKYYDEVAEVQRQISEKLVSLVRPHLKKDSQILDLGSGTSFIAKQISQYQIIEVDISAEMLGSWHDRPNNIKAIQTDFENLPFAEKSFDLIISSFALHWSSDFAKNFSQFFSLLKPKGIFAFCLPTAGSLQELSSFNINRFPANQELIAALEKSGFQKKYFVTEEVRQAFVSELAALKFFKKIGANTVLNKTHRLIADSLSLKKPTSKNVTWKISYLIYKK
ncbi:MAG: methyltransferase domain-containing protein [Alphaproteobacteria bacterium]|nr:methyltransferase domain-containing protein [Alphaproteobacteria bacterium]